VDSGNIANGWYVNLTTANPIGYAADNAIYAAPTNSSVTVGAHWNFILAVTNYGPSVSSNVYVSDILPAGWLPVSSTPSLGLITNNGVALIWNLGTLPVNAGATLALNFLAISTGSYTNTATVLSDTDDSNSDDDVAVATLSVGSPQPVQLAPVNASGSGAGFQLTVAGNAGASVIIQASTNLFNWVNLFTNISPFTFTNLDSTNYPSRFYRAVVGP